MSILTTKDFTSHFFFFPVFVCNKELSSLGIDIYMTTQANESLLQCDILMLDSKFFRPLWSNNSDKALELLKNCRQECSKVAWLDTSDSTGTTQFQVMPYVDKYLKKQILRDKVHYTTKLYGARLYTDYYYNQFHLDDQPVYEVQPVKRDDLSKLCISWNIGLGRFAENFRFEFIRKKLPLFLKKYTIFTYKRIPFSNTKPRRPLDITFRGKSTYDNSALSFQRRKVLELIENRGVDIRPVSRKVYLKELRTAKCGISPFGNGEICFRDFESFVAGCTLVKPDMSHLETWPDYYVNNETYVPFSWDFSDFNDVLDNFLMDKESRLAISQNAQDRYRKSLSDIGMERFVDRFLDIVKSV